MTSEWMPLPEPYRCEATSDDTKGGQVDYTIAKDCKNEKAWHTCIRIDDYYSIQDCCLKCGKCGRVFENGYMVYDGGTK